MRATGMQKLPVRIQPPKAGSRVTLYVLGVGGDSKYFYLPPTVNLESSDRGIENPELIGRS